MVRKADPTIEMTEFIRIEAASGLARLNLSRADVHNAFNEVTIAEITEDRRSGRRGYP